MSRTSGAWVARFTVGVLALTAAGPGTAWAAPFTIVLSDGGTPGGTPAAAIGAVSQAAQLWQRTFSDSDVVVRIGFEFSALGAGPDTPAASTAVYLRSFSYDSVRQALIDDASSFFDRAALNTLESQGGFRFVTSDPEPGDPGNFRLFDGGDTSLETSLLVTRANAKALGLLQDDGQPDAVITFNSDLPFDYERSNGITGHDFVGVAQHEMGHALGFFSGVDILDAELNNLNDFLGRSVFSPLDLFRYSDTSILIGETSGSGPARELRIGAEQYLGGAPYLSFLAQPGMGIAPFATGFSGSGDMASHWTDIGIGLMGPTEIAGRLLPFTASDSVALDVVGWDPVPEPTVLTLLALGLGFVALRRQRKPRAPGETRGRGRATEPILAQAHRHRGSEQAVRPD